MERESEKMREGSSLNWVVVKAMEVVRFRIFVSSDFRGKGKEE